jgi:hypothetical protein
MPIMKKSTITTAIAAALVTLAFLTPPGSAAPLDPKRVPADAKWVIHLDYEALTDTQLMEIYRSKRPQRVERARKWLQERYGIDPQQDLKDATLFSDSYRSHSGAIVLRTAYDREKVEADVLKRRGVKTTQWQDYTL